ncbi:MULTISPECIES: polysaccharide deacetylase family protein [unclassified Streptomyces]|uniref:polysaccharide deacetylase family protein n=1 Tax=unclassified Streptomyces TaxID=2593676 RepID=UPI002237FA10|nr:polysaccharide deacetylase family protein [Streptomyces sp. SHP 1-2]MCW5250309.1 polysaccharide deacetylase family protein [Streptomyces sp. SHP 1-2]
MTKDQLFTRRRVLLAGAASATAAGTVAALSAGLGDAPAPPPVAAPGAPAARPLDPSAFRLAPSTGYGAPRAEPGRTAVRSEPILRVTGRGRTMMLTFDDGPDPRYTPEILDTLAEHRVRATFFVCGEMAEWNRDLLARMADEGHVVGNHTWSHPLLTGLTRRRVQSEMERTSEIVAKAYGEPPRWFRAPYGAWNRTVFRIGADLGMEPLAWTVDTLDWTAPGTGTIVGRVADGAAPGVVVLSHDAGGDRSQSVHALRAYLPALLDSGYQLTVPRRQWV